MNRAAVCALRRVGGNQRTVIASTRRVVLAQVNRTATRSLVEFCESSWAADKLKKMGLKVVPETPKEIVMMEENFLETPDEKIIKLVDEVLALNVIEMCQFQRRFQRRLGIDRNTVEQAYVHAQAAQNMVFSGHVPTGGGGGDAFADESEAAPAAAAAVVEKTAFDIKLGAFDAKAKIKIIKEVRAITGLGLKEAKELVEKAPCVIKEGLKKEEAEAFKKLLVDAGAEVDLV